MGDNRNYIWHEDRITERPEYSIIENWITEDSKIIDLGCGNGSLLRILKQKKNVIDFGIEISDSGVSISQKNGLNVIKGNIDAELKDIADNSFDFAICNVTIQMVMYPEILLKEMKRIAKRQIISFPNFAFILQRIDLLINGRMPRKLLYGYDWHNTGHIHQFSIKDFKKTTHSFGLKIEDTKYLLGRSEFPNFFPNIFATAGIFLTTRSNDNY